MASQLDNPGRTTATASVSASARQAAKVKDYVNLQLEKTRKQVKTIDFIAGILVLVAFVVGFLVLVALVDAWIWPLSTLGRWICFTILVGGCIAYAVLAIVPLLLKRINPDYAAKMIEAAKPSFRNSLMNYVSLRKRPEEIKPAVLDAVSRQAATDLASVPSDAAVDQSKLIRLGFVLIGLTLFVVGYKMLSPKDPLQTVARILAPAGKIARPAVVRIENVEPGDTQIFFGERLNVTATIRGRHQPEDVQLVYSTFDGRLTEQKISMTPAGSQGVYGASVSMPGGGIQSSLRYRIVARDGSTPDYEVVVRQNPSITIDSLVFNAPAYTKIKPMTLKGVGDIEAIEGTKVTVHAVANLPIKNAYIELLNEVNDPNQPPGDIPYDSRYKLAATKIKMQSEGTSAIGTIPVTLDSSRNRPFATHYRLRFVSSEDDRNRQPNVYPIHVIPDLAPEIEFRNPVQPDVTVPVNGSLAVDILASDLDFEIKSVNLNIDHQGNVLLAQNLALSSDDGNRRVTAGYTLRPGDLGLQVGDRVVLVATAADNRISHASGQPDPNISRTQNYSVTVIESDQQQTEQTEQNEEQTPENKEPGDTDPENPEDQNQDAEQKSETGGQEGDSENSADDEGSQGESDEEGEQGTESDQSGGSGGSEASEKSQSSESEAEGGNSGGSGGTDDESGRSENGDSQSGTGEGNQDPQNKNPDQQSDSGSQDGDGSNDSGDSSNEQSPSGSNQKPSNDQSQSGESSTGDQGGSESQSPENPNSSQNDAVDGKSGDAEADPDNASDGSKDDSLTEGSTERLDENSSDGQRMKEIQKFLEESQAETDPGETESGDSQSGNQQGSDAQPGDAGQGEPEAGDSGDESQSSQDLNDGAPENDSSKSPQEQESDSTGKRDQGNDGGAGTEQNPDNRSSGDGQENPNKTGEQADPRTSNKDTADESDNNESPRESSAKSGMDDATGKQSQDPGGEQTDKTGNESGGTDPGQSDSGGNQSGGSESGKPDVNQDAGSSANDDSAETESSGTGDDSNSDANSDNSTGSQSTSESGQPDSGSQQKNGKPSENESSGNESGAPSESSESSESGDAVQASESQGGKEQGDNKSLQSKPRQGNSDSSSTGTGPGNAGTTEGELLEREKTNLEHARKATDMVLNKLSEQRYDPDPELLDRMNWTKQDLNDFLNRWEEMKRAAEQGNNSSKVKYDKWLKSLGLRPKSGRRTAKQLDENVEGMSQDSAVNRPPAERELDYNSFLRDLNRPSEKK